MAPYFFQPLLPSFHSHLNIPMEFYSKHMNGTTNEGNAVVKLTSDASDKTWEVMINGRKLTQGWQNFATGHDLRVGDIVIFRRDGDLLFHVTCFGPSCCQILYDDDVIQISSDSDEEKYQDRFLTLTLTPYSLRKSKLCLPGKFVWLNGMEKARKITLVDRYGFKRTTSLKPDNNYGTMRMGKGWREFCDANGVKAGDSFKLELIKEEEEAATHLLKFYTKV